MRAPYPGEVDDAANAVPPAGHKLLLIIRQVQPGIRVKVGYFLNESCWPVPDVEAIAHGFFDVASG
jgi:hypothetical protein